MSHRHRDGSSVSDLLQHSKLHALPYPAKTDFKGLDLDSEIQKLVEETPGQKIGTWEMKEHLVLVETAPIEPAHFYAISEWLGPFLTRLFVVSSENLENEPSA